MMKKLALMLPVFLLTFILFFGASCEKVYATDVTPSLFDLPAGIEINIGSDDNAINQTAPTLQLMFMLVLIMLAPSILVVMTCFTRLIIVFFFVRSALGTQQMPPNQVLIGLALFITIFLMGPTLTTINETAIKPLAAKEISQEVAIERALEPLREFMFKNVQSNDLALFSKIAGISYDTMELAEIPTTVLIPSFIISEITQAFIMGFFIYLPFIVVDMVVASTLMAMGMMMLPPAMISLPFKILLFILVDGWNLIIENVVRGITR